jgi:Phasin protein
VQVPLADAGLEQGRRVIEATAQVTDVYRDAAERSADDVQALVSSFQTFGRGLQQWQHAYLDLLNQSAERMARKRSELMNARSPVQVAEVQRDLYLDAVNGLFTANTRLLQLGVQIAQDAMRPLQGRARTYTSP